MKLANRKPNDPLFKNVTEVISAPIKNILLMDHLGFFTDKKV